MKMEGCLDLTEDAIGEMRRYVGSRERSGRETAAHVNVSLS